MTSRVLLVLVIVTNLIVLNNALASSSFDLNLNIDGIDNRFQFVETTKPNDENRLPTVIILDDDQNPTTINPSSLTSVQTYSVESNENLNGFATVIDSTSTDNKLLFAMVQISNGSFYDISPSLSLIQTRKKRSLNDDYVIRSKDSILQHGYVTIEWNNNRERREVSQTEITNENSTTEETRLPESDILYSSTLPFVSPSENETELLINVTMTTTTPRPIPEKSRHLYLEITALVDSLITNDVRALLDKTELEVIEILKLYYTHVFMGVEQIYRQSLIHETLDVHIRLSKIIFATNKHRLPWESFKNISSLSDAYRKSPNHMQLRPNISMDLLKSLHHAYVADKFDQRFFKKGDDHIVTFTRLDLINGAGSAFILGTCLPSYKYAIIQEDLNAYSVTVTVAHELGHNLGFSHDETENECNDPKYRYIMSPVNMNTPDRQQLFYFSECSIKELNKFVNNGTETCWKNKITSTRNDTKLAKLREMTTTKLGQLINVHQQCRLQYGPQAFPFVSISYTDKNYTLYEESICKQLRCFKKIHEDYMYWQDGAFDGTPCDENRICQEQECVVSNQTIKKNKLDYCPYGDLVVPISMLGLSDHFQSGNMQCADALNLLRSRGLNVTNLCYESTLPFRRVCCEECKKHSIPECGDMNSRCSMFSQYCNMEFMRINGVPIKELCAYTCGLCPQLPSPPTTTTTTTPMNIDTEETSSIQTTTKAAKKKVQTTTAKPRKYVKPKSFDKYTCIDSADCSQLIKIYSKLNKKVKNWCTEYTTMVRGRYFAEACPKYCSLCNVTSECDQYKLCRHNGTCIKDEHGTYQCVCSKSYFGTLCEYRHTCSSNSCSSKTEYCIQTQGENYICLPKDDKEKMRIILNGKN